MHRWRWLVLTLVLALLGAGGGLALLRAQDSAPGASRATGTSTPRVVASAGPISLNERDIQEILDAAPSHRPEVYYDVTVDRFANGDPGNDRNGRTGDRDRTGYDPTDPDYFHGGDLAGLRGRLDYIAGLGVSTIVLSPIWAPRDGTARPPDYYLGNWVSDLSTLAPRYGTADDLGGLVADAHALGLRVVLRAIVDPGETDGLVTAGKRWIDLGVDGFWVSGDGESRLNGAPAPTAYLRALTMLVAGWRTSAAPIGHVEVLAGPIRWRGNRPGEDMIRVTGARPVSYEAADALDGWSGVPEPGGGWPAAWDVVVPTGLGLLHRFAEPEEYGGDERVLQDAASILSAALLSGGSPVLPAGIEQGLGQADWMHGIPPDQFTTQMPQGRTLRVIGGPSGARDRYDPAHPIYRMVADLVQLRRQHPALASGLASVRFAGQDEGEVGIRVLSRIDKDSGAEHLVVFNPNRQSGHALITTASPGTRFTAITGTGELTTDAGGSATLPVSPSDPAVRILRGDKPIGQRPLAISKVSADSGSLARTLWSVSASLAEETPADVVLAIRPQGEVAWTAAAVGAPPYAAQLAAVASPGSTVDVAAVAIAPRGAIAYATSRVTQGGKPVPETVITAVGDVQEAAGCSRDQLDCAATRLTDPDGDGVFTWTSPPLESGEYNVRVAVGTHGTEIYGLGGVLDGEPVSGGWYDAGPLPVTVSFIPETRWVGVEIIGL